MRLSSTCTCLVYTECEHAAATLLAALDETSAPDADEVGAAIDAELEGWIAAVNQSAALAANGHAGDGADCVLYVLEPAQRVWRDAASIQPVAVSTFRARRLRGGVYGREHPLAMSNLVADDPASFVGVDDQVIGRLLGAPNAQTRRLGSVGDGDTLRRMLETGPLPLAQRPEPRRLTHEEPRPAGSAGSSTAKASSTWSASSTTAAEDIVVVGIGEPWYIDLKDHSCGRIETSVPHRVARLLLKAPAVSAAVASLVRQKLQPSGSVLPLPEPLRKRERLELRPVPILHLHCPRVTISRGMGWKREEQEVDLPLARVLFDYAGRRGRLAGRPRRDQPRQGQPPAGPAPRHAVRGADDRAAERAGPAAAWARPASAGSRPRTAARTSPSRRTRTTTSSRCAGSSSTTRTCPSWPAKAGAITFGEDYPYQVVAADDAWKVDINDSRHRLVRPRPRHRGRRRAGGAAADPARPVRARAGRADARPRSTSSATTMSSARCPTAACCRSPPPA